MRSFVKKVALLYAMNFVKPPALFQRTKEVSFLKAEAAIARGQQLSLQLTLRLTRPFLAVSSCLQRRSHHLSQHLFGREISLLGI